MTQLTFIYTLMKKKYNFNNIVNFQVPLPKFLTNQNFWRCASIPDPTPLSKVNPQQVRMIYKTSRS